VKPAENGPKYVAYVTRCGARVAGHGQGGSYHFPALRDWRAGLLSAYPARVFVFRVARMASKGLHVASGGGVMRSPVRGRFAYTEIECGPGSKVIGALTRMFSLNALPYTVAHRPLHPSIPPRLGAPSTLTQA
jgi:hypothetical protein